MTAGRGIVHSEMPKITQGDLHGFQLWINLPKKDKMIKPRYQDYQAKDIPVVTKSECDVRVMAGEFEGETGTALSCFPLPTHWTHCFVWLRYGRHVSSSTWPRDPCSLLVRHGLHTC